MHNIIMKYFNAFILFLSNLSPVGFPRHNGIDDNRRLGERLRRGFGQAESKRFTGKTSPFQIACWPPVAQMFPWSQIFKELLAQAKITYNLSPALRRRRRQSLPQQASGTSTGPSTPQQTAPPVAPVHVPSAAQLAHLQQIQDKSLGGKRNSCILS